MLELTATQRGAVRTMPSETSTKYVLRSHTFGWYGLVLNVDHVQPTFVAESALACWKEAIELYSERLFLSESGPIRVEIDFSPILQVLEPEVERNCQFHSDDPAPEFWDELVESLERAAESGRVSRERGETGWEHFAQFSQRARSQVSHCSGLGPHPAEIEARDRSTRRRVRMCGPQPHFSCNEPCISR